MSVLYTAYVTCDLCGHHDEVKGLIGAYADHEIRKKGWQIGRWAICPECVKCNDGMAQRRAKKLAQARVIKDCPDSIPERTGEV